MERYNGWSNYETWLCALWMDNDPGSSEHWHRLARGYKDARSLADSMRAEFEENMPDIYGFWQDLIIGALREVDWREIAEHYMAELESE